MRPHTRDTAKFVLDQASCSCGERHQFCGILQLAGLFYGFPLARLSGGMQVGRERWLRRRTAYTAIGELVKRSGRRCLFMDYRPVLHPIDRGPGRASQLQE